jgi:hypothetical protein
LSGAPTKMNSIINVGDVLVEKDDVNFGFVILSHNLFTNGWGFRVIWFDDGVTGLLYENQLDSYLELGELVKLSEKEAFVTKIKYSENLTQ